MYDFSALLGSEARTYTLQQFSILQHFWPWKYILPLALVFIIGLLLAYLVKLNLDYRDQFMQLQLNNTGCFAKIQDLREKVEELKSESTQMKKSLNDVQKEKDEIRERETQCRLDMIKAESKHDREKYEAKEEYRLDMHQRRRSEQDNEEYENRFWRLIECLDRPNTVQDDSIFSRAFNAIWRAIESGVGKNRDVENCLKMINNRFQRRLLVHRLSSNL